MARGAAGGVEESLVRREVSVGGRLNLRRWSKCFFLGAGTGVTVGKINCNVVRYGEVGAAEVKRNVVGGADKLKNVAAVVGGEVYVLC